MRKVLVVMAALAAGTALLSCAAQQRPATDATSSLPAYEPRAPVARAPLPPPEGYASPPQLTNSPTPLVPYGNYPDERAEPQTAPHMMWRASPRWAAVKGNGCVAVEQDPQSRYMVQNCSKEDADTSNGAQPAFSGY